MQQGENELKKLNQLAERLKSELPHSQYEQFQKIIHQHQEHLQLLQKTCQQTRDEHEKIVKIQTKFNEDLIAINDWFKRLIQDFSQPIDLNLSLNHIDEIQTSISVSFYSIYKRK